MSVGYATAVRRHVRRLFGAEGRLQDHGLRAVALAQPGPSGRRRGPGRPGDPGRIITKAPTAELKPNQTDQDSLPPYDALDDILNCLVEEEKSVDEIVARGHDRATVARVWRLLDRAEYKRRQARRASS